jgi:hypothetical protein
MARIPTYDELQVQQGILPAARQSTTATPDLLGGGAVQQARTGAALSSVGGDMLKIAEQMQDRENMDVVFRAETGMRDEATKLLQSARERRGVNAKGLVREAEEWWDKKIRDTESVLTNEVQRRAFMQRAAVARSSTLANIAGWESEQHRVSATESGQASVVSATNYAAANFRDANIRTESMRSVQENLATLARINGWSPEVTAVKQMEAQTVFHRQIVQNYVNADMPDAAKSYFEVHKDQISGSEHDTFTGLFKAGERKLTAQRTVDDVVKQGLSDSAALDFIRGKLEGEARDIAITDFKTRMAERDALLKRARDRAEDDAVAAYENGGRRFSAIPTSMLEAMDPNARTRLRRLAQQDADDARRRAEGAPEAKSDLKVLEDIFSKIGTPAFDAINFATHPGLSRSDRVKFMALKAKPEKQVAARLDNDMFNSIANEAGLPVFKTPSQRSDTQNGIISNLRTAVEERLQLETNARGRALNPDETRKIVEGMMFQTIDTTPGTSLWPGNWGGQRPVYSLPPTDPRRVAVEVDDDARRRGVTLTPQQRQQAIDRAVKERASSRTLPNG